MSPGENLSNALDAIEVSDNVIKSFCELCNTAEESGILPFPIRSDVAEEIIKLCMLAKKYKSGKVPSELRM